MCWIGNQELDFPETFRSTLLSGQELGVSIFSLSIYLLEKRNQWNLKFWSSCLLEENSLNFFMLNWESGFRFYWNFPQHYCQNRKLLCQFFAQSIYFLDKSNQWNLKFWSACLLKENSPNFFILNLEADFRFYWTFHSSFLSGQDFPVSIFCSVNLSFKQKRPMKFEILTFSLGRRKFIQFFYAELRPRA